MQADSARRFIFEHLPIRGAYVELSNVWQTIAAQKEYPDGVRQFLGELLVANILITSNIKREGKIITQISENPKVDLVVSECSNDFKVRATAKFAAGVHKDSQPSYSDCVSQGLLAISVDSASEGKVYQSLVLLSGHDLSEALNGYMLQSEQLRSLFIIAYINNKIVGFMLQQLPGEVNHQNDDINRVFMLANTLTQHELLHTEIDELLSKLFHEDDLVLFEAHKVEFSCTCSHDRVLGMLRNLGKEEVMNILHSAGNIEVTCDFCNTHYVFNAQDVDDIFAALRVEIDNISQAVH